VTELTTERLILRPVVRDDLPDVLALAGDAAVAEMTGSIRHPLSAADVQAWLEDGQRDDQNVFAIVRAADKVFLGAIGLMLAKDDRPANLGYWLGRAHWGQGYATEAVRRVLRLAFGEMKLREIEAGVFPGNTASMQVLAKTGFREVGPAQRPAPARGPGERDVLLFIATRASFAQAALSQAVGRE
jgi:ribosomal-protein-alanine N-acetyltransferase